MRISLIQPTVNTYFDKAGIRGITEPLGLCYLAAVLEREGHQTQIIHQLEEDNDTLLTRIKDFDAEAVGISSTTHNFYDSAKLANMIKQKVGDIPIIYGGYHLSGSVNEYAWNPQLLEEVFSYPFDYGIFGEGEESLKELINALAKNEDSKNIAGTVLKNGDKIKINSSRNPIADLDSLPFPKREGLPQERYFQNVPLELPVSEQIFASIYSSRGCRYSCNFCQTHSMWGKWRTRSAKNIADEIESVQNQFGTNYVWFPDEDFLADKQRIVDLCSEMENRNLKLLWRSFLRATDIQTPADEELLKYMYKNGYRAAFLGIETMNPDILENLKGLKTTHIEKALDICSRVGISIRGTYMVGYPEENKEALEKSISRILELPLDEMYVTFLTPFPGTGLYRFCKQRGLLLEEDWSKYDSSQPIIKSEIIAEELMSIKKSFTSQFYLKSIPRMLRKIESNPRLLKGYREFWERLSRV